MRRSVVPDENGEWFRTNRLQSRTPYTTSEKDPKTGEWVKVHVDNPKPYRLKSKWHIIAVVSGPLLTSSCGTLTIPEEDAQKGNIGSEGSWSPPQVCDNCWKVWRALDNG